MSLEPALLNLIIVDGFCVMHNTLFAVVVHRSRSRFLASAINSFYDTKIQPTTDHINKVSNAQAYQLKFSPSVECILNSPIPP